MGVVSTLLPFAKSIGNTVKNAFTTKKVLDNDAQIQKERVAAQPQSLLKVQPKQPLPETSLSQGGSGTMTVNGQTYNVKSANAPILTPPVQQKTQVAQTGATLSNIPKTPTSKTPAPVAPKMDTGMARDLARYNASLAKDNAPKEPIKPILPPTQPKDQTQNQGKVAMEPRTQNSALSDLQKQYLAQFNQTPQEQALQAQIDALNAQADNVRSSEALGLNKIEDQPIAMNFIQGQQAALQRQAAAQTGALAAQQTPLTQRLAQAQAQRLALAQGLNAQMGFQSEADKLNAPQYSTVNGNVIKINPITGVAETVYSAPQTAEGFTLGEGQLRYDANGKLIASGAPKDNSMTPYQQAQLNLEQQKLAQGKAPTAAQYQAATFANRTQQANDVINNVGDQFGSMFALGGALPNFMKSEDRQMFEQAQNNFVNAVLRRESGAAIASSEFENAAKQYFPLPGDSAAVLAQKKQNRETVIHGLQAEASTVLNADPLGLGFNQESQTSQNGQGSVSFRNNNPLNIKYGNFASGYGAVPSTQSTDGGQFAKFPSVQAGLQAAKDLLTSPSYANLPLEQAMRRWSGNGYGADVAPELNGKSIGQMTPQEISLLISKMQQREGWFA